MHLGDSCLIGAIEGLGLAKLELSGFDGGRRHGGRNRWARVRGWKGCEERMLLIDKEFGSVVFKGE